MHASERNEILAFAMRETLSGAGHSDRFSVTMRKKWCQHEQQNDWPKWPGLCSRCCEKWIEASYTINKWKLRIK